VAVLSLFPSAAHAGVGDPPKGLGLSPVAASIYKARFALCSLETLTQLAAHEGRDIDALPSRAAAALLAAKAERGHGRAAVEGCTDGLLYRDTTDQTISGLRADYRERVDAEKYVAAAYLVVVIALRPDPRDSDFASRTSRERTARPGESTHRGSITDHGLTPVDPP
jgi:hypothetical protein